jgi:hypothetical protein
MTSTEFNIVIEEMFLRSKKTLCKKASSYATDDQRLKNFYQAAAIQEIPVTQACVGMMTKHYASVCDMAKNPTSHSLTQWREKLGDLRNYTFLCEALLSDLEIK